MDTIWKYRIVAYLVVFSAVAGAIGAFIPYLVRNPYTDVMFPIATTTFLLAHILAKRWFPD